jgi:hypothetical protein
MASLAIREKRVEVISGGSTGDPSATERMVPTISSKLASLRLNPDTRALTNSTMSSWTGRRSIMMTRDSGYSVRTVAATRRLSSSHRPTSSRITCGLAALSHSGSLLGPAATTLKSEVWFSIAVSPSRTRRVFDERDGNQAGKSILVKGDGFAGRPPPARPDRGAVT